MQKESWASIPKSSCFIFCRLSIWNLTTRRWKILFSWNQHQDCFINLINITKRQPNCLRILETPYKVKCNCCVVSVGHDYYERLCEAETKVWCGRNQSLVWQKPKFCEAETKVWHCVRQKPKFGVQWIVEHSVLGSPSYHLLYFFEFRGNHLVVFFKS